MNFNGDRRRFIFLVAMVVLFAVVIVLAVAACGERQPNREEEEYIQCIENGGEWIQIATDLWTCQNEETRNG